MSIRSLTVLENRKEKGVGEKCIKNSSPPSPNPPLKLLTGEMFVSEFLRVLSSAPAYAFHFTQMTLKLLGVN